MDIATSSDHSKIIFTKMFVKKSFYTIEGRVKLNEKSIKNFDSKYVYGMS